MEHLLFMNLSLTYLFIGTSEIIFILFILVLFFGSDKLPEIARGLGKGIRTLKDATNEIKHEVTKNTPNTKQNDPTKPILDEINKVKDEVEDTHGSVKRNQ